MKNIGYISADFFPMSNAASVRAGFFVDKLIEEKNSVVVFASTENKKYNIVKNRSTLPTNKNKNTTRLIKEFIYGVELFFRILFYKKMDLYILSTPPFFVTIFAFFAVKIKNANNIILDVRDIYPEVFFENKLIKRKSFLGSILIKIEIFLYRHSKSIITVTNGLKSLIDSTCQNSDNVQVVKNGFDKNIFNSSDEKFDDFTIVFHGTLGRFQNIEILVQIIEAFQQLDDKVQFLVLGNGSKDILIKNKNFTNLKYIESAPYSEIPKIISKCHLGLSFRTDGKISKISLPVKIFEYIGVGIPMVVTPISEAGEMVAKEQLGLQCSNDLNDIIKNIQFIRDNYTIYIEELNKKQYKFSRQYEAENFYNLIKSI